MTDSPQPGRPQQVTTAVVLAVAACVLAVINLFDMRDELRGSSIKDTIADAQGGVGNIADEQLVVQVLEVLVLVSGALAATAAVLAVYAWQRNRGAWIAFFVVAGLMVLTLPVAGVLPVLLLASGATFLAGRPARDWFADRVAVPSGPQVALAQQGPPDGVGGPPGQRPEPPPYRGRFGSGGSSAVPAGEQGTPPVQAPTGPTEADGPPAYGPWHGGADLTKPTDQPPSQQPTHPPTQQPTYGQGYPPPGAMGYAQGYGGQRDPDKRPGTVTAACVTTWIGSLLVALLTGLVALVLLADRGSFVREFQRQADVADLQITADQVLAVAWTMAGLALLWCLLAVVLAVLAFRRSRGGRIALAVSAALTVLVSLLLILSVVAAVPLLLGIAVLVLLFTGGANDWYARRSGWSSPGSGPYGGQPPSQPGQGYDQPYGQQPPPYGQQQPPYDQQPPPGRSGPW